VAVLLILAVIGVIVWFAVSHEQKSPGSGIEAAERKLRQEDAAHQARVQQLRAADQARLAEFEKECREFAVSARQRGIRDSAVCTDNGQEIRAWAVEWADVWAHRFGWIDTNGRMYVSASGKAARATSAHQIVGDQDIAVLEEWRPPVEILRGMLARRLMAGNDWPPSPGG
jgi:hypothetical protein